MFACNNERIDDLSKRNENWYWFVDKFTGRGSWVPVGEKMGLKKGDYTLFYSTGEINEFGKIKDSIHIDTANVLYQYLF